MTKNNLLKINPYVRWGIVNFVVLYILTVVGGGFVTEDNTISKVSHKNMIGTERMKAENLAQPKPKAVSELVPSEKKETPPLAPESTTTGKIPLNSNERIRLYPEDFTLAGIKPGSRLSDVKKILGDPISSVKENVNTIKYVFPKGVMVYIGIGDDVVTLVILTQSSVKTRRGIAVGDTNTKFLDAYGKANTIMGIQGNHLYYYDYLDYSVEALQYPAMHFYVEGKTGKILLIASGVGTNSDSIFEAVYEATR